jgi:hypothetical protein
MRGSRIVSRLPRQARSGVNYKDAEGDAESVARVPSPDAVARRHLLNQVEQLGIAKGKRTLTLKRARTISEPPLKLEGITNVHVIREALFSNQGGQVVESAEGRHGLNRAFAYLLEAASGASGDGEDDGATVGHHISASEAPEIRNNQEEDRFVNSITQKGMEEAMDKKTEQDIVSSADEKRYSRRLTREKQDSMYSGGGKKVEEDRLESLSCATGNIALRATKNGNEKIEKDVLDCVPGSIDSNIDEDIVPLEDDDGNVPSEYKDEDAEDSWSECSDSSNAEKKRKVTLLVTEKKKVSVLATKSGRELKTFIKKNKVVEKDQISSDPILMPIKPTGPLILSARSVAHRRVVGLSRRYRPPPLHPYLLGS